MSEQTKENKEVLEEGPIGGGGSNPKPKKPKVEGGVQLSTQSKKTKTT